MFRLGKREVPKRRTSAHQGLNVMVANQQVPHRDGQSIADAQQNRKLDVLENRIKRGELWIILLTAAMTIAAFAAVYVARKQWRVMELQTKVMQDTLADARKSAIESDKTSDRQFKIAEGQASSLKILADANKDIAGAATKSAAATERLAGATSESAKASRGLADSSAQSTVATQRLADAALDANSVSRQLVSTTERAMDTTKNISRAFVFAKGVELQDAYMSSLVAPLITGGDTHSHLYTIGVQWENTGGTPTQDLTITNSCWSTRAGQLAERAADLIAFDVSSIDTQDKLFERHSTTSMVLAPKQIQTVGVCAVDALGQVEKELGAVPLYYTFGTARYRDIFNPGYVHRTEYCFVITPTGSRWYPGSSIGNAEKMPPLRILASPCREHNCSDEECNGQSPLP